MSSSSSSVPVTTVQEGFRKLGAFIPLVKLMRDTLPDRPVRLASIFLRFTLLTVEDVGFGEVNR